MTWDDWAAVLAVAVTTTALAVMVMLSQRWSARHAARLERERHSGVMHRG